MRIVVIVIVALFIAVTFACGCLLCSGGGAFLWLTTSGTPQVNRPTSVRIPSPTRPPFVTAKPTVTPVRPASQPSYLRLSAFSRRAITRMDDARNP